MTFFALRGQLLPVDGAHGSGERVSTCLFRVFVSCVSIQRFPSSVASWYSLFRRRCSRSTYPKIGRMVAFAPIQRIRGLDSPPPAAARRGFPVGEIKDALFPRFTIVLLCGDGRVGSCGMSFSFTHTLRE